MNTIDMDRARKDVDGLLTSAEKDTPLNGVLVMVVSSHDNGPLVGIVWTGSVSQSEVVCGIEDLFMKVLQERMGATSTQEITQ